MNNTERINEYPKLEDHFNLVQVMQTIAVLSQFEEQNDKIANEVYNVAELKQKLERYFELFSLATNETIERAKAETNNI